MNTNTFLPPSSTLPKYIMMMVYLANTGIVLGFSGPAAFFGGALATIGASEL
jgi:hypothetical protein